LSSGHVSDEVVVLKFVAELPKVIEHEMLAAAAGLMLTRQGSDVGTEDGTEDAVDAHISP
jgi:hypothetical protein